MIFQVLKQWSSVNLNEKIQVPIELSSVVKWTSVVKWMSQMYNMLSIASREVDGEMIYLFLCLLLPFFLETVLSEVRDKVYAKSETCLC